MTAMQSDCSASGFSAAGFEPVGGGESDSFAGQHGGQAGCDRLGSPELVEFLRFRTHAARV